MFCFELTKEGGHQLVGDDVAVDGTVAEAFKVFDFIDCGFDLDGAGFVFNDEEIPLSPPLLKFTADQLGGFIGGECFHRILMLSAWPSSPLRAAPIGAVYPNLVKVPCCPKSRIRRR